jgi:hypothetical protein
MSKAVKVKANKKRFSSGNPFSCVVTLKCTIEDKGRLEELAMARGVSLNAVLRELIRTAPVA